MQMLQPSNRTRGTTRNWFTLLLIVGGLAAAMLLWLARDTVAQQLQIQIQRARGWPTAEQDPMAGVYLPSDRALSRAIARARERLAEREYHETLSFLHGILARDEDAFLDRLDGEREQLGLKATARRLIGELPPEGRDVYELLYGAAARRQLEAALQSADQQAVANVVRQYFHTSAGYEAALVLAQMEADQGHRLAAAQLYQELLDSPRAAAQFEPQLSVMAALNLLAAGQREAAAATLRSLVERLPAAEIVISGKSAATPASSDPLAWLTRLAGQPLDSSPGETNWLTLRGDAARNAHKPGGRPHLRARWQARVVNDPGMESQLASRAGEYAQRGIAAIPAARPIAVGDVVVMRTPENVVAIDWQTGKRIWETREDGELDAGSAHADLPRTFEHEPAGGPGSAWEQRVWDDALTASLSSDGERVFVLRGAAVADEEQVTGWMPGFRPMGPETAAPTNQLAAFDLATQGKLVWELDGSRAAPPLDGAFFLGAPVAIDNTLYVMAEIRSAIYLLALDPATGRPRWQQQLIGLEQSIALDPQRRHAGATPSYAGGILVCPTGASTVIAIDVVKREFAWVYRYPRESPSLEGRHLWQRPGHVQITRSNDRWLDSAAIIAEGRVLVAPPESAELHCLDLQTGKFLWKARPGDGLFLGGVERGHVLLVGAESVQALRLSDGTPAWEQETVPLPSGSLPAGQGYLSDGYYYLPLTSGGMAQIHLASGELIHLPASKPAAALGNLICYRGSVLSQSALVLDKFEQLEALEQRAQAALAGNPDDATALGELAELKRADGDTTEAVKLLKRAWQLAPDDPVTQEMLAEVLLDALESDFAAFRDDVPLVAGLIRDRDQQIDLLRLEARGLEELGQPLAAWDAYIRLAELTREEPAYLRIDTHHRVRSDRWIAGRLATLWAAASSDDREALAERLAARRPSLDDPSAAAELRHYLAHFDKLPGASEVRAALADFLVQRGRTQEAELELLALSTDNNANIRARAAELLAELASESLPPDFDTIEAAGEDSDSFAAPRVVWPRGKVDAALVTAAAAMSERGVRPHVDPQGHRALRIEQDFAPEVSRVQWFVAVNGSELVARNGLGADVFQLAIDQNNLSPQYRDSTLAHGARLGHLLFVTLGGQIMALDSRPGPIGVEAGTLWHAQPVGQVPVANVRGVRRATTPFRTSRRPVYHPWSGRKRVTGVVGPGTCALGPATPRGVVFQENSELKCVDPLSGEVLWARTDLPAGCELFGDGEVVFAADATARVAHVVRMIDGVSIGQRKLPQSEWLLTAGRNVAALSFNSDRDRRVLALSINDAWSEEVVFSGQYSLASRVSVVEPNAIAVYEPTGRFQLIDARTGEVLLDETLAHVPDLHSIYTLRTGDELFLLVSGQTQSQQYRPLGQPVDFPLINGFVFAFDLKSGEALWPAPAVVRNRGLILAQPADVPLLVFAERKTIRDATSGGGSRLRVLCLDRRTGQTVYRNDNLPDTVMSRFRIRAERGAEPIVALEMSAGAVQLTMTDRPRPPQPPANDDLEEPREFAERGLRGIGARVGAALRGAIDEQEEK